MTDLEIMQAASRAAELAFPAKMEEVAPGVSIDVNAEPGCLFAKGYEVCLRKVNKLLSIAAKMRDAQRNHRKTLVYGYRSTSIQLEKEFDVALAELGFNGNLYEGR